MVAGGAGIQSIVTDIGPHTEYYIPRTGTVQYDVMVSNNETRMDEIQEILNRYKLNKSVQVKAGVFDCSDISELIWYVMTTNGHDCALVVNDAVLKNTGNLNMHMFVWVATSEGIIVIEPTNGTDPHKQIGKVLNVTENDTFYTSGWFSSTPEKLRRGGYVNEVRGITADYPIELLPLVRETCVEEMCREQRERMEQETTLEKMCREQKTRWG